MCSFPSPLELHVQPIDALSLCYWLYLISHILYISVITYAYIFKPLITMVTVIRHRDIHHVLRILKKKTHYSNHHFLSTHVTSRLSFP
jgi:hypothetical protein